MWPPNEFPSIFEVKEFLNSQFVSSLIGALAGAFAGAMSAHRISDDARKMKELEDQIRATNAAIMTSFMICNSFLNLKSQQLIDLNKNYSKQRSSYEQLLKNGQRNQSFHYEAQLTSIPLPEVSLDILKKQIYEKLNTTGRALALVSQICDSFHAFSNAIRIRQDFVDEFKTILQGDEQYKANLYFGFPLDGGRINTLYPDSLNGICNSTDDLIFYSSLLCYDLEAYGKKISAPYRKKNNDKLPPISNPQFAKAVLNGLMPNSEKYEDWLKCFPKVVEIKPIPWHKKIFKFIKGN